jgi:hypothetical protein
MFNKHAREVIFGDKSFNMALQSQTAMIEARDGGQASVEMFNNEQSSGYGGHNESFGCGGGAAGNNVSVNTYVSAKPQQQPFIEMTQAHIDDQNLDKDSLLDFRS